jgi:hypothetical protein
MIQRAMSFLLLTGLTGCYNYAPVEVHVVDSASNRPLAGIALKADYRRFMEFMPPKLDEAVTDASGIAVLSVCTNYRKGGEIAVISAYTVPDHSRPAALVEIHVDEVRKAGGSPYRVDLPPQYLGSGVPSGGVAARRREVDQLMTSDLTESQKLEKLRRYIPLGTSSRDVRELLGPEDSLSGEGPGWFDLLYDRYFLIVGFDNTDRVVRLHFAQHS